MSNSSSRIRHSQTKINLIPPNTRTIQRTSWTTVATTYIPRQPNSSLTTWTLKKSRKVMKRSLFLGPRATLCKRMGSRNLWLEGSHPWTEGTRNLNRPHAAAHRRQLGLDWTWLWLLKQCRQVGKKSSNIKRLYLLNLQVHLWRTSKFSNPTVPSILTTLGPLISIRSPEPTHFSNLCQ